MAAVVIFAVILCAVVGACVVLGLIASRTSTPNALQRKPLKTQLKLSAAEDSQEADLEKALGVLRRRLEKAKIDHEIDRFGRKFTVRLPEDSVQVAQATQLMLAGGDLIFKIVVRKGKDLAPDLWDQEFAKIESARAGGKLDGSEKYSILEYNGEKLLLENPGFLGYFVAEAWTKLQDSKWEVQYTLTPEGSKKYQDFANASANRLEATIMDGKVESTATWGAGPFDVSQGQFWRWTNTAEPGWSKETAENYATLMTSGRLPIQLMLEEE